MTVAAIDRLVHHSTIFELHHVESYRANIPVQPAKMIVVQPAMLFDAVY